MKGFKVRSIKKLEPSQGLDSNNNPVVLDRWSLSALAATDKHPASQDVPTFCILSVKQGTPNPVKEGDYVSVETRTVTPQATPANPKPQPVEQNYFSSRFDSEEDFLKAENAHIERLVMQDDRFRAELKRHQMLAAYTQRAASALPAGLGNIKLDA